MSERIEYLNSPLVASPPRRMRSLPCGAIDSAFCCMIMQGGVIESECDHKTKVGGKQSVFLQLDRSDYGNRTRVPCVRGMCPNP